MWEKEFYKITEVAKELNCESSDIIHFGISNKLRIAAYIKVNKKKYVKDQYFNDKNYLYDSGYYYINCGQLEHFEFNESVENISEINILPSNVNKKDIDMFFDINEEMMKDKRNGLSLDEMIDDIEDEYIEYMKCCIEAEKADDIMYDHENDLSDSVNLIDDTSSNFETDTGYTIHTKSLVIFHDDLTSFMKNEWPTLKRFTLSIKRTANEENIKATNSLLKMVIAMATEQYGYDFNDKKSNVPRQIVEDVESIGLKIDDGTVLKWLKESALLIEQ